MMPSNASSILAYYSLSIEEMNVLLGIALNSLLLILIKRYSNANIGSYKYLLGTFAVFDIFLCSIHGLLNPIVVVINNTMGAALYTPYQSHGLSAFYYACFSMPFSLMNIHFLYRYWSVADPNRLALFLRPAFIVVISLYPLTFGTIWGLEAYSIHTEADNAYLREVRDIVSRTHPAPIEDGWLMMDDWRDGQLNVHVLIIIIITIPIMFGSLALATTLATLTYKEIVKATKLSHKNITVQYTLLIAVCAQTLIPVVCVYIPYFLIIMSPFLSIPGKSVGLVNSFSLCVSIFPGWDAAVIILLIRDYRVGLMKMLGLRREKKIQVKHTQFTTAFQPTTM